MGIVDPTIIDLTNPRTFAGVRVPLDPNKANLGKKEKNERKRREKTETR